VPALPPCSHGQPNSRKAKGYEGSEGAGRQCLWSRLQRCSRSQHFQDATVAGETNLQIADQGANWTSPLCLGHMDERRRKGKTVALVPCKVYGPNSRGYGIVSLASSHCSKQVTGTGRCGICRGLDTVEHVL